MYAKYCTCPEVHYADRVGENYFVKDNPTHKWWVISLLLVWADVGWFKVRIRVRVGS